jgi:hypothetical protein
MTCKATLKDIFKARGDELQDKESAWVFQRVYFIRINIIRHTPLRVNSHIKLQRWINKRKLA